MTPFPRALGLTMTGLVLVFITSSLILVLLRSLVTQIVAVVVVVVECFDTFGLVGPFGSFLAASPIASAMTATHQ